MKVKRAAYSRLLTRNQATGSEPAEPVLGNQVACSLQLADESEAKFENL